MAPSSTRSHVLRGTVATVILGTIPLALWAGACSSTSPHPTFDAQVDTSLDAPGDMALDAPDDTPLDAPDDAPRDDTALDAPDDAPLDAPDDAPRDVTAPDAPHDARPEVHDDVPPCTPADGAYLAGPCSPAYEQSVCATDGLSVCHCRSDYRTGYQYRWLVFRCRSTSDDGGVGACRDSRCR